VRQIADVVLLDMPYTFDDLYFEALSVVDQVVLVARPTGVSIEALKVVSEAVGLSAVGATQHLVINCYGPRAEEFTETELSTALVAERIWTIANDPDAFEVAMNHGRTLHQESPRSRAWPGIVALANQLIGLHEPTSSKPAAFWPTWSADLFRKAPRVADVAPTHR
jgi:Flp pilus assembly CpaE family ATPase